MKRVVATPFPDSPELRTPAQLGAAVRAARTQSGLTLEAAAMLVGVAKQTLSDLETGRGTVSLGIALRVAEELGVSLFAVPAARRATLLNMLDGAEHAA